MLPSETSYPYDECYRAINLARGLHADSPLVEQLLADGTCTVTCESPLNLFIASIYLSLQFICGATGGALNREAFNTQEQVFFALLTYLLTCLLTHSLTYLLTD
jgi:hypothetical protein